MTATKTAPAKPETPTVVRRQTETPTPPPTPAPAPAPTPTANGNPNPDALLFDEAPYSWNTNVIDANGFVQQFTVRAATLAGFHQRIEKELEYLHLKGYKPAPVRSFGKGERKELKALDNAPLCPEHDEAMHPREWQAPDGTLVYFWSCQHRDGKNFCKARVNERPTPAQYAEWKELNR